MTGQHRGPLLGRDVKIVEGGVWIMNNNEFQCPGVNDVCEDGRAAKNLSLNLY